jgi:hypothetical protein
MIKALKSNKLVTSPIYGKILHLYNEELIEKGKVNNKKFYETHILPEMPNYNMQSWYQFLKKFKSKHGIVAATVHEAFVERAPTITQQQEGQVSKSMLSITEATSRGLTLALNIGHDRLKQIMENPSLMSAKEAADLVFKALKAQDSRMHAVGRIREDNREQEKFERTFSDAAYDNDPIE